MNQPSAKQTSNFFRQGSWMVIASLLGGVCMFAVHLLNRFIPDTEYGRVGTLLSLFAWLQIPSLGLQSVFADQTAAAMTPQDQLKLNGAVRRILFFTFTFWLGVVFISLIFQGKILSLLNIPQPTILWMLLLLALTALWSPIFLGLLQGRQNFFWMGWVAILSGLGRFVLAGLVVLVMKKRDAEGIMIGILLSSLVAVAIPAWFTRDVWMRPGQPMEWKLWLGRVVPLTVCLGITPLLSYADSLIVTALLPEQLGQYTSVATVGRGLILLTAPLIAVLFPMLVRNVAKSEKSNVLYMALFSAAGLAISVVIFLTFFLKPVFTLVYPKPEFLTVIPLISKYAWAVFPLAIGNL